MKILHLLQSDRFSGAENVVCQIVGMFRDEPGTEMVYCSRDGQIREALAERGVTFVPIRDLNVREVRRVLREQKPDIIHAHDMRASFVAALCCGRTPLISHIHNNNFDARGLSVKSVAYIPAGLKARHIFWVSQSSFSGYVFHRLFAKKSSILYNIIDIDALYRKMQTDPNTYDYDILYIGRLTYQKNPQRLMHVLKKVTAQVPEAKIGIIGTGDLEDETKAVYRELQLENNVDFLGFRENPLKMLHDAKAMVMTSRWEGTPMCALEALSLGVPIVATPADGLCDLITHGENGFLSDDDDTLAEKLCEIITQEDLHQHLSENAKTQMRKKMDIQAYAETIRTAYVQ